MPDAWIGTWLLFLIIESIIVDRLKLEGQFRAPGWELIRS